MISNFIKQHVPDSNKTARDVLAKAKELQKNGEITSYLIHCKADLGNIRIL